MPNVEYFGESGTVELSSKVFTLCSAGYMVLSRSLTFFSFYIVFRFQHSVLFFPVGTVFFLALSAWRGETIGPGLASSFCAV